MCLADMDGDVVVQHLAPYLSLNQLKRLHKIHPRLTRALAHSHVFTGQGRYLLVKLNPPMYSKRLSHFDTVLHKECGVRFEWDDHGFLQRILTVRRSCRKHYTVHIDANRNVHVHMHRKEGGSNIALNPATFPYQEYVARQI